MLDTRNVEPMTKVKRIPLMEMFGPTIQGEGAVCGQQTYFLRFGLCDYKCKMCDSMHAVDPTSVRENGRMLTQDEIAHEFHAFHRPNSTRWVTLSGGNPCIHDLSILMLELKTHGFKIALETQGTLWKPWVGACDIITVSPKGPGMGEDCDIEVLDQFLAKSMGFLDRINLKVVIFDERDLEFARMIHERYAGLKVPFYLSLGNDYPPGKESPHMDYTGLVMYMIGKYKQLFEQFQCDPILSQMRFLPQLHALFWGNEKGK